MTKSEIRINDEIRMTKCRRLDFHVSLAVGAFEEAAEGEESQFLQDGMGGEIGFVDDFVDGAGFVADLREDELLAVGEICWWSGGGFLVLRFSGKQLGLLHIIRQGIQGADDVFQFCHQRCAVPDQLVGAGGHLIIDAAGQGEYGAAVFFVG